MKISWMVSELQSRHEKLMDGQMDGQMDVPVGFLHSNFLAQIPNKTPKIPNKCLKFFFFLGH